MCYTQFMLSILSPIFFNITLGIKLILENEIDKLMYL